MKHKLLLLFTLCAFTFGVKAQTAWTNVGNGLQQRVVSGRTEYRFVKNAGYTPFGVTDSLDLKVYKTTTVNGHALSGNITVTKSDIGLGNADNTSDVNKPISTATQTALDFRLNIDQYSPYPNSYYWTHTIPIGTTDHNRDGAKLGKLGDYLFLFGGWHPDTIPITDNEVYRFNKQVTSTAKLANAPWAGRHTYGFANTKDAVYVFGGDLNSGSYLPDSWKGELSPDSTISWTLLNSNVPWGERILFGSTYHNGAFYVIGGQETPTYADGAFGDVWKSVDAVTWVKIADGLTQFAKNIVGGVVSYGGYIYVIGGGKYDIPLANGTFENYVYRSKDGITWEQLPNAPWEGRQYMDCVVHDGKIFMVGGNTSENTPTDNSKEVWSLDLNGNWQKITDGVTGRHATAVASYKDMLIVSTGNYWNDTWTLNKYSTSLESLSNTIPARDNNGYISNNIFNATTGGSGGYIVGSTSVNPNGDASLYYTAGNTVITSKGGLYMYSSVTPTSLPNLIIDNNGYILVGRGGSLPTLNTDFGLNVISGIKSSGKVSWGNGSYVSGEPGIYNTVSDGTLLIPKHGSVTDFVLTNGSGFSVFDVPTGTQNIFFSGKASSSIAPTTGNDYGNKTYIDGAIVAYANALSVINTTGTPFTKATLNSTYPSAAVLTKIICPNISTVYQKYDSTNWFSQPITVLP
jgi:hypothetical protein